MGSVYGGFPSDIPADQSAEQVLGLWKALHQGAKKEAELHLASMRRREEMRRLVVLWWRPA